MGYSQVRYDSRVVNYDRTGLIRLTTGLSSPSSGQSYQPYKAFWGELFLLFLEIPSLNKFIFLVFGNN